MKILFVFSLLCFSKCSYSLDADLKSLLLELARSYSIDIDEKITAWSPQDDGFRCDSKFKTCYKFIKKKLSWEDAFKFCKDLDTNLISFSSKEKFNRFLDQIYRRSDGS